MRKINVVDTDSAAWATYLAPGGINLPHVKLLGRDGKLLWERSGAPPMLAAGVEDALGPPAPAAPPEPVASPPRQTPQAMRIAIAVTDAGYTPARVTIPRGRDVILVFTRTSEKTCAVDVHLQLPGGSKIDRRLPLGRPVEIRVRMNMVKGRIVVD